MIKCPKCNYSWEITPRSKDQNSTYWGFIVTPFSELLGIEPLSCHQYLKENCNSTLIFRRDKDGNWREIKNINSTTELNTKEFNEYMERCIQFAADWGCYLQMPGDPIENA